MGHQAFEKRLLTWTTGVKTKRTCFRVIWGEIDKEQKKTYTIDVPQEKGKISLPRDKRGCLGINDMRTDM